MARKIKKVHVKFVSLVPRGANNLSVVYKEDGQFDMPLLSKGMDDEGELAALVYVPDLVDLDGDVADAQIVKQMAHSFMFEGPHLDIRHDGNVVKRDRAFVAESFLLQADDPRFQGLTYDGKQVSTKGAWAVVLKIQDEELRRLYRDGGWNGVSLGGFAEFEPVGKQESFWAGVKALFPRKESKMEPKELKELLEGLSKGFETLTGVVNELGKAQKTQAETLAKLDKEFAEARTAELESARKEAETARLAEVEKLKAEKAELEKLLGKSNQDATDQDKVEKGIADAVARAREVATWFNKNRGGK